MNRKLSELSSTAAVQAALDEFFRVGREVFLNTYRFKPARDYFVIDPRTGTEADSKTTWDGSRVRKADVVVAKNYLSADEIDTLNRLVVIFLEQAELRAKERRQLTLEYWRVNVDRLLEFNDRPVLQGAGRVSNERMTQIVHERYEQFDAQRRRDEAQAADEEDLRMLEAVERQVKKGRS